MNDILKFKAIRKIAGIIALTTIIILGMVACSSGDDTQYIYWRTELIGIWENDDKPYIELEFANTDRGDIMSVGFYAYCIAKDDKPIGQISSFTARTDRSPSFLGGDTELKYILKSATELEITSYAFNGQVNPSHEYIGKYTKSP